MNIISAFIHSVMVVVATTMTPAVPPSPSPLPITRPVEMIHAEDTIEYMNQKTTYSVNFPKEGGKVTGEISGLCNGALDGDFDGQNVKGNFSGTCTAGFIPVPASATYIGVVSFPERRVKLTVDAQKPVSGRYYPSLRF